MLEKDLHKEIKRFVPFDCVYQRIETMGVSVGIPDVVYINSVGAHTWMELKIAKPPKTDRGCVKIQIRPEQINWIQKVANTTNTACIVVAAVEVQSPDSKVTTLNWFVFLPEVLRELNNGVPLAEFVYLADRVFCSTQKLVDYLS